MKKSTPAVMDTEELRRRAEQRLQERAALEGTATGEVNSLRLVNEILKIHQIELEIQHEEMVLAREELEAEKRRYAEFYEFAPMGYVSLDQKGVLRKMNRAGAQLLGVEMDGPLTGSMEYHISPNDRKTFRDFLASAFEGKAACEVELEPRGMPAVAVRLEGNLSPDGQICLTMMQDITERNAVRKTLDFLLRCGLKPGGLDFFQELTCYLAQTMEADCVSIDRLTGPPHRAETLTAYSGGSFKNKIGYPLEDTPGITDVAKLGVSLSERMRLLFPEVEALRSPTAEHHVGATLWSADGKPIGLIAAIGSRPANQQLTETLMRLISTRVAGEMERLKPGQPAQQ